MSQARGWVGFDREQAGDVVDGRRPPAAVGGDVGQRGVAVAAHARSVEALDAEGQLVCDNWNAQAAADAAEDNAIAVMSRRW